MNIVFFGTPIFASTIIQGLIDADMAPVLCVSQEDKAQGRKQIVKSTPVHALCEQENIEIIQPRKIKTDEFYEKIKSYAPDFIVTAAYGRILPKRILDLAKYEAVNVHGSLLPKYRGASPVQATLLNCDEIGGISILRMTEDLDSGPVFAQAEYSIPEYMRADELMLELAKLGAKILPQTLTAIKKGELSPVEQSTENLSYVGLIDKSMGEIDWHKPAREIEGQVRGLYPWPGTFTYQGKKHKRIKIHQAKAFPLDAVPDLSPEYDELEPGTVVSTYDKSLWVKTGSGLLQVLEIQQDGSKALSTSENYHNYQAGKDSFHS